MLARILAGLVLVAFLFIVFRFAMSLRFARLARETERREEEARGRRVVAEVPGADGLLRLFTEDAAGFYFPGLAVARERLAGARLLLNGGVLAQAARQGFALPDPAGSGPEEDERERWEVAAYLDDGTARVIPCGSLREGVSRDIATAVFRSLAAGLEDGVRAPAY